MGEREIYNYLYSGGLIEDENKELCGCGDRIIIYGFRTSDDLNLFVEKAEVVLHWDYKNFQFIFYNCNAYGEMVSYPLSCVKNFKKVR